MPGIVKAQKIEALQPLELIKQEEEKIQREFGDIAMDQQDLADLYQPQIPASIRDNQFNLPPADFERFQNYHLAHKRDLELGVINSNRQVELNNKILGQIDEGNVRRRNKLYTTDLVFLTRKVIKHENYLAKKKAKDEMLEALKTRFRTDIEKLQQKKKEARRFALGNI